MAHGGKREGAGRPPGSRSERRLALEAETKKVAERVEAVLGDAFDGDAHTLLMSIYRDPSQPIEIRIDAAKAAIRFEKPVLAAVDVSSTNEHFIHAVSAEPMSLEEWERTFCQPDPKQEH